MWTLDLARRLDGTGVAVFAADPGVADTGTQRDYPWPAPMKAALVLARPLPHRLLSARKAAHSSIRAASAAELATRTGQLLDRKGRAVPPPQRAGDREVARTVDRASRDLVGLDDPLGHDRTA